MALIRGEQISGSVASASYALTASYVLQPPPSHQIVTGSVVAEVNVNTLFLIKSGSIDLLKIQADKVLVLATQSAELTGPAPNGGIYFTSSSFWVGLD